METRSIQASARRNAFIAGIAVAVHSRVTIILHTTTNYWQTVPVKESEAKVIIRACSLKYASGALA